ncbi:MAG: aspartate kinase [Bacteroidetes bacterium]|nr:aspartate kinase [Bacteroidota bacterium]
MKVFKFGGASIKDAEAIRNVAKIIGAEGQEQLLVVVSAMGKTTNALEAILAHYIDGDMVYRTEIDKLKSFHFNILQELYKGNDPAALHQLEDLFLQFEWFFELGEKGNYDFLYDQVVAFGEIFSTKIIATYLQSVGIPAKWFDARNFIITNDNYREAAVDFALTESLVQRKIPQMLGEGPLVTQGFIGKNRQGHTTTLGREGSDFSAAIFAWALQASELCIWKDVPGILNADPKRFANTVKFQELSYTDAVEMSYYGASVLHPKTMQPLQNRHIPLHVRSFVDPTLPGTRIADGVAAQTEIPVAIVKDRQCLIRIASANFSFIAESNLSRIFQSIAENRLKINLMRNSAMRFELVTDCDARKLSALLADLDSEYLVDHTDGLTLYTTRNADPAYTQKVLQDKEIVLEQKTGNVAQYLTKSH